MAIRRIVIAVLGIILAGLLANLGYRAFDRMRSHPTLPTAPATPLADAGTLPTPIPAAPAAAIPAPAVREATATFAGGCFWCTEADFEKLPGVTSAISGYTGGTVPNPSYNEVSGEATGHYESVEVRYDPRKVSYGTLLDWFFEHIDPTDPNGQFVDQGPSYKSAIFYRTDAERAAAEDAKKDLAASGVFSAPIATLILPAGTFYIAEDYHQDYHAKNPVRYAYYRSGSGRDAFLATHWTDEAKKKYAAVRVAHAAPTTMPVRPAAPTAFVKPSADALRAKLTPLQYAVTQEAATEPSFDNAYWNEERTGIYVDIVSGEPLFSSQDKFDSGTGWPSFTKPLVVANIAERKDGFLFLSRTEIRSTQADSHLGHVFEDGPADRGGLRYCMNSAALRFIPKEDMAKEGYGAYLPGLP